MSHSVWLMLENVEILIDARAIKTAYSTKPNVCVYVVSS